MPKAQETATHDFRENFEFLPVTRDLMGVPAAQKLSWGGIRSGKTQGALMYFIFAYCLKYAKCDILVLRRNFKELESGAIKDFKELVPASAYTYNAGTHIATFLNGSRVVFGHCAHGKMSDVLQYLGTAYCGILVDECSQFSPDVWEVLVSRNTLNVGIEADAEGKFPVPMIWGCTNPVGPYWGFYNTVFGDHAHGIPGKPWDAPESARADSRGNWWVTESGEKRLVYNASAYVERHSTPLDNPYIIKKDPGLIQRLKGMSKAKQEKYLLGLAGKVEGQYFDSFDPEYHVVSLKEDPDAVIWQDWQPVVAGGDWGMGSAGHYTAFYFLTKALVRVDPLLEYKLRTVCFREVIERNKTDEEMAGILARAARFPGTGKACAQCLKQNVMACKHPLLRLSAIYFSHEKFSKQMEANSPAVLFSKHLVKAGLCGVTPAAAGPSARVNGATTIYTGFKKGNLVILDSCPEIIRAIPAMETDPDDLNDVLKPDGVNKFDDAYDGFRYTVYGMMSSRSMPENERIRQEIDLITDPMAKRMYLYKMAKDKEKKNDPAFERKSNWSDRI
jgi:hypothetical protein